MIDFDVVTGPGPSEKPRAPAAKSTPSAPAKQDAAMVPRATLLPRVPLPRPTGGTEPRT